MLSKNLCFNLFYHKKCGRGGWAWLGDYPWIWLLSNGTDFAEQLCKVAKAVAVYDFEKVEVELQKLGEEAATLCPCLPFLWAVA